MEEQWRESQKRAEQRKVEHRRRLNTPALYAIEVYCQVFAVDGVTADSFVDEDIRIRYKFLDFACVEIEKAKEDAQSGATSTTGTSSPWSSTPSSPRTPVTPGFESEPTATAARGQEGNVDGLTPSMRNHLQGLKEGTSKTATSSNVTAQQSKEQQQTAEQKPEQKEQELPEEAGVAAPAPQQEQSQDKTETQPSQQAGTSEVQDGASTVPETSAPASESASSPTQSSTPSSKKRKLQRDPRYFDPKKLLKRKPEPPPEPQATGDLNTTADATTTAETATTEPKTLSEGVAGSAPGDSKNNVKTGSKKSADESKSGDLRRSSKNVTGSGKLVESGGKTNDVSHTAGPDSTVTDVPDNTTLPTTDQALTEYEDFGEEQSMMEDNSDALFFENGKSLIFTTIPLNLLYSLPRYPLMVIFFKPSSDVLGIVRVDLSTFAEAVDSSIVLTKSIPLSAERNDAFDILLRGRKVGWADLSVRMTCFGPFLLHKIFIKDNPNEKETPEAKFRRTASNPLIVVQTSAANLGLVRHRSKLFVSKSNPSLVGRVNRDISTLPSLVCADENLISAPSRPKPKMTVVEVEEMENERKRKENLSRFPQYKCIDDWEVVFNRQVIKDLIAKNRRPFQPGSPDRTYVESYFPELLPSGVCKKGKSESESDKGKKYIKKPNPVKKSSGDGPSLAYLELDEAWLKDNNLQRIRRKSVRPNVRTSIADDDGPTKSSPSGAPSSTTVKLPSHSTASMSHVAINHFDIEANRYTADSRIFPYPPTREKSHSDSVDRSSPGTNYRVDLKNASNVAMFHFNPFKNASVKNQRNPSLDMNSSRGFRQGQAFNTRHPRVDSNLEKYNPLPERPYTIEIRAPERSMTDKLVQGIRQAGDEVEAIGGDTKTLLSMYKEFNASEGSDRYIPEHLKRSQRTTQTPEETSRVLSNTYEPVLIEVDKGVPVAVSVRGTPYWEGHAPVCSQPINCPHFIFLHPGFGYYGR